MKKTILAAAVLATLTFGACSNSNNSCASAGSCHNVDDQVYTGVLPAADAAGVRYTLALDYDKDDNCKEGDYKLTETYLEADSTSVAGHKDRNSFTSEGDFTVRTQDGKKYLKLVRDADDSAKGSAEGPLYFLVDSDSTLTLVNADLQPSENSALNYTLRLAK